MNLRRARPSPYWLLALVAGAAIVLVAPAAPVAAPASPASITPIRLPPTVRVRSAGRTITVPFEDYVVVSALTEVSPVGETPATVARIFEVQAVLARTYAAANLGRHRGQGFDLCDETHCQLYQPKRLATSRFTDAARAAVSATKGQVLTFGGRIARATFHADCGGHTVDASAIWRGAPLSYLVGAADEAPDVTHREWIFHAPADGLRRALNRHRDTAIGSWLVGVKVTAREPSGRATAVEIRGEHRRVLSGERLRTIVNTIYGPKALQSTRFDVEATAGGYHFEGTGYGHGVGLCQVGAAARARRGEPVADILSAYFPGAKLSR